MHVQDVSVLLGTFMLIFLCMFFHLLPTLSSSLPLTVSFFLSPPSLLTTPSPPSPPPHYPFPPLPTPPSFDWWLPRGIAKYVTHAAVRKMFGATESQYQLMEVRALHIVTYCEIHYLCLLHVYVCTVFVLAVCKPLTMNVVM